MTPLCLAANPVLRCWSDWVDDESAMEVALIIVCVKSFMEFMKHIFLHLKWIVYDLYKIRGRNIHCIPKSHHIHWNGRSVLHCDVHFIRTFLSFGSQSWICTTSKVYSILLG
ncbi:hypothetical protein CICLE_v10013592mg [Citrus x clementina]|uniref:Uncharacterized protein n=1 Tax=Citrus clementina TaxID=85681 RepID=V4SMI3_CITCL|nr:hypothetical protein CICLE_v10013592mg [Citrus x clementina]